MIRKKVTLFEQGTKSIGEASTSSATFATVLPLVMEQRRDGPDIEAAGLRLLLGVNARTNGGPGTPVSLNVFLQQQDRNGNWQGVLSTTMTPVVTATTFETLEIYPGIDITSAPLRRSFLLSTPLRAVASLQGSITATPSFAFYLDAELFS
jgi:hypothetical protein